MLLELKNVSKFYYSSNVVSAGFTNVSCKLDLGEFVVITGQSGSGKSTLLNVLSGLDNYQEGEMFVNGEDTSGYSDQEIEEYRKKYIANIFQNFNLVSSYSVYKNIALNLIVQGEKHYKSKVNEAIKKVGLWKYRNTKASKLSGGQKQRVAIARALVRETPIIIADEPTGDLDETNAKEILKLFHEISKNKLVIIVTHNYSQVEQYATRKLQMSDGHIIEDVTLKETQKVEKLKVKENTNMRLGSIIELSFINTFNVIPKFLLLLIVFIFLTTSVIGLYSSYKLSESEYSSYYSYYFEDDDRTRFILKNKDKSAFTNDQIKELQNGENIVSVNTNELFIDNRITLTDNSTSWFSGKIVNNIENAILTSGKMPENNHELVIIYSPEDNLLMEERDILNTTYQLYLENYYHYDKSENYDKYYIVGTLEDADYDYYSYGFYFNDEGINNLKYEYEKSLKNISVNVANYQMENFQIITNEKVPQGEIYVTEYLSEMISEKSIVKKNVIIQNQTLYYLTELDLKISKLINDKNCKILDLKSNDYSTYDIFVNPNDYQCLFDISNYQISLYIDDYRNANKVKQFLNSKGYDYLYVADSITLENDFDVIESLFVGFTISAGVIGIFFIAYFIIRIILKSRNTYFATIRMLGATKNNIRKLIENELIIVMCIAYAIVLLAMYALRYVDSWIVEEILEMVSYYTINDYIILFIVLLVLTLLIGNKYARKLYSSSAISIYKDGE